MKIQFCSAETRSRTSARLHGSIESEKPRTNGWNSQPQLVRLYREPSQTVQLTVLLKRLIKVRKAQLENLQSRKGRSLHRSLKTFEPTRELRKCLNKMLIKDNIITIKRNEFLLQVHKLQGCRGFLVQVLKKTLIRSRSIFQKTACARVRIFTLISLVLIHFSVNFHDKKRQKKRFKRSQALKDDGLYLKKTL